MKIRLEVRPDEECRTSSRASEHGHKPIRGINTVLREYLLSKSTVISHNHKLYYKHSGVTKSTGSIAPGK